MQTFNHLVWCYSNGPYRKTCYSKFYSIKPGHPFVKFVLEGQGSINMLTVKWILVENGFWSSTPLCPPHSLTWKGFLELDHPIPFPAYVQQHLLRGRCAFLSLLSFFEAQSPYPMTSSIKLWSLSFTNWLFQSSFHKQNLFQKTRNAPAPKVPRRCGGSHQQQSQEIR